MKNNYILSQNLYRQLLSIGVLIFLIIAVNLGYLLPKVLLPVYEKNVYEYLNGPLNIVKDLNGVVIDSEISYIYISKDQRISTYNLEALNIPANQVLEKITSNYGKFKYLGKTYYYSTREDSNLTKIAITNDNYIKKIKQDVLNTIFPILLLTLLITFLLIIFWSRRLVMKIGHLKNRVENLDNDNYVDNYKFKTDDELLVLAQAIDKMKITLKEQEEYKNQMYQNISHDFKTPITVIKSYIEAMEDGIEPNDKGLEIIKEQIKKLELKVHSLLYLNKLTYMKDSNNYRKQKIDISDILKESVDKFKYQRNDIKWTLHIESKKPIFKGTEDMWEAIIDNLLNNFIRYAKKEIKITVKTNKIIFYNDGTNIDTNILNDIFTPYTKGIKGQFGLGLSIVKKTLTLFGYEINVKNEKKGVSFIIK